MTALVGNSMLLYLTKHDGWGSRRRPLSPATNPENLSHGRLGKDRPTRFFNSP